MQELAGNGLTDTQVRNALTAAHVTFTIRAEILDANNAWQGNLSILDAVIEHNIDRAIKRTLTLTLPPEETVTLSPLQHRIRPVIGIAAGGTTREWTQGVYLWQPVERSIGGNDNRAVTLPELGGWRLTQRAITGWSVTAGTTITDALVNALHTAGVTDIDLPSSASVAAQLVWDPATSWGEICNQLCAAAGLYSVYFDGDGIARSRRIPDLTTVAADWTYATDAESVITQPARTQPDLSKLANRVLVRGTNASLTTPISTIVTSPATSPWSFEQIGVWLDMSPIDDTVATDTAALVAHGQAALQDTLIRYERITVQTRAMPIHESNDVIAMQVTGDSEYADANRFHERGWQLRCPDWTMTHELARITTI